MAKKNRGGAAVFDAAAEQAEAEKMPDLTPVELYGGRVLILPAEAASETPGGIVLPDTAKDANLGYGKVVLIDGDNAVWADEVGNHAPAIGDTVFFSKYATSEVKIGGVEFKVAEPKDIFMSIEAG